MNIYLLLKDEQKHIAMQIPCRLSIKFDILDKVLSYVYRCGPVMGYKL